MFLEHFILLTLAGTAAWAFKLAGFSLDKVLVLECVPQPCDVLTQQAVAAVNAAVCSKAFNIIEYSNASSTADVTLYTDGTMPIGVEPVIQTSYGLTRLLLSPDNVFKNAETFINTNELRYATNIYNVLLHELLHVIGLDHPEVPNESVMSYRVRLGADKNVLRDVSFLPLDEDDVLGVTNIAQQSFPQCVQTTKTTQRKTKRRKTKTKRRKKKNVFIRSTNTPRISVKKGSRVEVVANNRPTITIGG